MGGWNIFVRNCEGKAYAISIQNPAVSLQFVDAYGVPIQGRSSPAAINVMHVHV